MTEVLRNELIVKSTSMTRDLFLTKYTNWLMKSCCATITLGVIFIILVRIRAKRTSAEIIQPVGTVEGQPPVDPGLLLERKIQRLQNIFEEKERVDRFVGRLIKLIVSQWYCNQALLFVMYSTMFLKNVDVTIRVLLLIVLYLLVISLLQLSCDVTKVSNQFLSKIYQPNENRGKFWRMKMWYHRYLSADSGGRYAELILFCSEIAEVIIQVR